MALAACVFSWTFLMLAQTGQSEDNMEQKQEVESHAHSMTSPTVVYIRVCPRSNHTRCEQILTQNRNEKVTNVGPHKSEG